MWVDPFDPFDAAAPTVERERVCMMMVLADLGLMTMTMMPTIVSKEPSQIRCFDHTAMSTNSPTSSAIPSEGAKALQERLNLLLSKLSSSIEIVKGWPSTDGDDASIHVKTTTKLIAAIHEIQKALEKVEGTIKADPELRKALQNCPVPINLLDLLDHGNGLNPDCFSRGLLHEALGQLAGLKRRKLALEMLGAAVKSGLNSRIHSETAVVAAASNKRQRSAADEGDQGNLDASDTVDGSAAKKAKTEAN